MSAQVIVSSLYKSTWFDNLLCIHSIRDFFRSLCAFLQPTVISPPVHFPLPSGITNLKNFLTQQSSFLALCPHLIQVLHKDFLLSNFSALGVQAVALTVRICVCQHSWTELVDSSSAIWWATNVFYDFHFHFWFLYCRFPMQSLCWFIQFYCTIFCYMLNSVIKENVYCCGWSNINWIE